MRVEAHLHLPRRLAGIPECISYRYLPRGLAQYERVLHLRDVTFAVQRAGLRKFRETGVKNVHAYVRGSINYGKPTLGLLWREAKYNPAVNDSFIDKDTGDPVYLASFATLIENRVYYLEQK